MNQNYGFKKPKRNLKWDKENNCCLMITRATFKCVTSHIILYETHSLAKIILEIVKFGGFNLI